MWEEILIYVLLFPTLLSFRRHVSDVSPRLNLIFNNMGKYIMRWQSARDGFHSVLPANTCHWHMYWHITHKRCISVVIQCYLYLPMCFLWYIVYNKCIIKCLQKAILCHCFLIIVHLDWLCFLFDFLSYSMLCVRFHHTYLIYVF